MPSFNIPNLPDLGGYSGGYLNDVANAASEYTRRQIDPNIGRPALLQQNFVDMKLGANASSAAIKFDALGLLGSGREGAGAKHYLGE